MSPLDKIMLGLTLLQFVGLALLFLMEWWFIGRHVSGEQRA